MKQVRLNRIELVYNEKNPNHLAGSLKKENNSYPRLPNGYFVFSDNWIHTGHKTLINERTGEKHRICGFAYYLKYEWDDPSLIQHGAGTYKEVKRSAVKTIPPLNQDDFYIASNEFLWN